MWFVVVIIGTFLVLLGVLIGALFFQVSTTISSTSGIIPTTSHITSLEELNEDGYIEVEATVDAMNLIYTHECIQVTMATTNFQTYSIQNGIDDIIEVRPTIHDVVKDLLDNFGMKVLQVKIDSKDGTELGYYANLYLQEGNKIVILETRPSDSTAIAVRAGIPILFKQNTFEELGANICS